MNFYLLLIVAISFGFGYAKLNMNCNNSDTIFRPVLDEPITVKFLQNDAKKIELLTSDLNLETVSVNNGKYTIQIDSEKFYNVLDQRKNCSKFHGAEFFLDHKNGLLILSYEDPKIGKKKRITFGSGIDPIWAALFELFTISILSKDAVIVNNRTNKKLQSIYVSTQFYPNEFGDIAKIIREYRDVEGVLIFSRDLGHLDL